MQRIVVASAHGGALETIRDRKTGFLFPPNDRHMLANTLGMALKMTPDHRTIMEQAARKYIDSSYSKLSLQRAVLSLYSRILAQ